MLYPVVCTVAAGSVLNVLFLCRGLPQNVWNPTLAQFILIHDRASHFPHISVSRCSLMIIIVFRTSVEKWAPGKCIMRTITSASVYQKEDYLHMYTFAFRIKTLTLCWFSMSFSCFVKRGNDGRASGSFCQQPIMIRYLERVNTLS